jgi:hypothetical protein
MGESKIINAPVECAKTGGRSRKMALKKPKSASFELGFIDIKKPTKY